MILVLLIDPKFLNLACLNRKSCLVVNLQMQLAICMMVSFEQNYQNPLFFSVSYVN